MLELQMYLPEHFEEKCSEKLHRIMVEHPLATLITSGSHGLDANLLVFELDADAGAEGHLITHMARANPLWREVADGDEALVVFQAGEAYISPNWYPSKHEFHRQVPTWNYQVVHARGTMKIRDDEKFVRGVVARLTRTQEARTGSDNPWKMGDSPREYIDRMLANIVGMEIEITSLVGKSKLSQNKEVRDRMGAAAELRKRGEETISAAMLETLVAKT